jgi:hypothetical protein
VISEGQKVLNKDLPALKNLPREIILMLDTAAGFKDVIGRDIKRSLP